MIFDSHAHYDDEAFDEDREAVLASLAGVGITKIVNVGSSFETTNSTLALARAHDFIYAAVGIHPSDTLDFEKDDRGDVSQCHLFQENNFALEKTGIDTAGLSTASTANVLPVHNPTEAAQDSINTAPKATLDWLREVARDPKAVAIGEIGLDYYWDTPSRDIQKKWFRLQLGLAKELGMPIIIHSRDAAQDTYDIMKEEGGEALRAVIHCFSYEKEMAKKFLDLGYCIGIGGVLTYKNARKQKEVLAEMPLDRLLLETDCPYLTPVPHRGERNSSLYLPLVIKEMAEIRGVREQVIEDITYNNACEFYRIEK